MTDGRDKPTDAENKARAVGRWANEGGAPPPADPTTADAGRASEPEIAPEAEALKGKPVLAGDSDGFGDRDGLPKPSA